MHVSAKVQSRQQANAPSTISPVNIMSERMGAADGKAPVADALTMTAVNTVHELLEYLSHSVLLQQMAHLLSKFVSRFAANVPQAGSERLLCIQIHDCACPKALRQGG